MDQRREAERIEEIQARLERAAERGRTEREAAEVSQLIVAVSTDIAAARRARDWSAETQRKHQSATADKSRSLEHWRDALRSAREREKAREAEQRESHREQGKERDEPENDR